MKIILPLILATILAACSNSTQSIPSPADPASAPDAGTRGAGGGGRR